MNPRNDAALLALQVEDDDAHVEAWHMKRALAEAAYVDHHIQADKLRGYPRIDPYAFEYSTDARRIGSEYPKDKDDKE